jgi:asparagine synthase (glutamine-hydrolysing)
MAAAAAAPGLAWVPSSHRQGRRRHVNAGASSVASPRLGRGELMGSRVHGGGSRCYIGVMPHPVAEGTRRGNSCGTRASPQMCSILACFDPNGALADGREAGAYTRPRFSST